MIRSFLCRLFKHKIDPHIDFQNFTVIRCLRCKCVLSQMTPFDESKRWDKSYTNGCYGKKRFDSFKEAVERMTRMKCYPATLHPYFCKHCDGFHLGNSKFKRR